MCACAVSDPSVNPPSESKSGCSNTDNGQSTFVGAKVPDMQTLVNAGKFWNAGVFADPGTTWNNTFPKPEQMKIDDLMVVEVKAGYMPVEVILQLKEDGYTPANSHEAMVFATQNPNVQMNTTYFYASYQLITNGKSIWIRFDKTHDAVHRYVTMVVPLASGAFSEPVWVVVHKK